jgi:hypothetical protein
MGAAHEDITFVDPDGNQVTETWWFQLDESDAAEMDLIHELLATGSPDKYLQDIVKNNDSKALLNLWRELLLASVCKREGKLLVKGPDVVKQFRWGGAYRQFFYELIRKDDMGSEFFLQIMPDHIRSKAKEEVAKSYTEEELLAMTDEQFYAAAGSSDLRDMDKRFTTIAMHRLSNKKNKEDASAA